MRKLLARKGIDFLPVGAKRLHPGENRVVAFEKYFIRKMKRGTSEPPCKKLVMTALGIGEPKV